MRIDDLRQLNKNNLKTIIIIKLIKSINLDKFIKDTNSYFI